MYSQSGMNGECKAQRGALRAMDPNTLIILFCFSAREDFIFCADGESLSHLILLREMVSLRLHLISMRSSCPELIF